MTPVDTEFANRVFGPPQGMTEEQVGRVPAYVGVVQKGSCKGSPITVVAWQPSPEELADLNAGKPVFMTMMATGLVPHFLSTRFAQAIAPA